MNQEKINKAYEYLDKNIGLYSLKILKSKLKEAGYTKKEISAAERELNNKDKGLLNKMLKSKTKPLEIPVLYLRRNNTAQVVKAKPKDGMLEIEGRKYHLREGSNWYFKERGKSKTGLIIPEWGMYPLGPEEYLKALKADESNIQYDMVRAIQTAETVRMADEKQRGKINPKLAVLIIIGLIVMGYFVLGG